MIIKKLNLKALIWIFFAICLFQTANANSVAQAVIINEEKINKLEERIALQIVNNKEPTVSLSTTQEIVNNTLLVLKNNNLNYEAIYFKKHENRNNNFKINARKNIANKGYNIILCIGSNDSDIYDEFTGIPIKIPIYIKNNLEVIKEE